MGGVDKVINGQRIGRGNGNDEGSAAFGLDCLTLVTSGKSNTAYGGYTLSFTTSGSNNAAFGNGALYKNTTGFYNSAFGTSTLQNNTTGQRNVGVGFNAGYQGTTGSFNTYIGNQAGYNNGVGSYNVAIGSGAMITSGTGNTASTLNMSNNVFVGSSISTADGMASVLAIENQGGTVTIPANALIYGSFLTSNRFVKINGVFSINPTYLAAADATYTKTLVAKPDGTFGWENRVANTNIYSTIETKTNGIWIDGKEIYRKFVSITIPAGADTSNPFLVSIPRAGEVISFEKCFMKIGTGTRKIPPAIEVGSNNNWSYDIMPSDELRVIMGVSAVLERVISGVVEYTKPD